MVKNYAFRITWNTKGKTNEENRWQLWQIRNVFLLNKINILNICMECPLSKNLIFFVQQSREYRTWTSSFCCRRRQINIYIYRSYSITWIFIIWIKRKYWVNNFKYKFTYRLSVSLGWPSLISLYQIYVFVRCWVLLLLFFPLFSFN